MDLLRHTFAGVLLSEIHLPENYASSIFVRLSYRFVNLIVRSLNSDIFFCCCSKTYETIGCWKQKKPPMVVSSKKY
jgi:hypothetical protein